MHLAEARGWGVHPLNNKGRRATYLRTTGARPFICRWGLDTLSKDKKLPAEFYGLSDRHAALLLNRFVSSDGHLDLHRRAVDIVLASEALVDDLWFLLLRLGISARKSYKRARCQTGEFDAWRLNISGRTNIVAFFERVGLLHGQEERSRALLSAAQAVETNTNVDVVPVGRAEAAEIADELATGRSRVRDDIRARRHPSYVGRDTFRRFCEERKYVGKYAWLANSDILWDRVDSVTPVGTHPVYDLSVPETHNFVANGVVIHNTLIALFMADAMGARRPLLLIPPSMRVPFENARTRDYAPHFRLPTNLRVMAYSQLSQASSTDLLEKLAPDVIVGDEAHNLRDPDAARTKRITRYLRAHPEVRCAWMSGTMTGKKIDDYAHLIEWALGQNSPVPRRKFYPILRAFNNILNAKPTKGSGDSRYVADASPAEWSMFSPLFPDWRDFDEDAPVDAHGDPTGETSPRVTRARELYQERLLHSPGVVGTDALSVGASLYFVRRELRTPQVVLDMIAKLEASWDRPDGERLVLALDVWRCARQLSQGFYYRWRWPHPDNKPDEADKDWLRTRSEWHKQVRLVCQQNLPHLDSPLLVTQAARRALAEAEDVAPAVADNSELLRALRDWTPHSARRWRGKPTPPTETVWVDRFLLDDACRWLEEHPRGLLWYADHAIADELAPRGVPVYGAGTNPEDLAGARGAALSIHVHKDGKNLQKHNENLFMDFLPSGSPMEQAISRTHRSGQEEDEVFVHYYTHTEPAQRAVASARNDAAYIQDTLNTPQRLCYGMWV